jgi:hypothetical protein
MLDVREWAAGDLSKSLLVNTLGGGDLSFDALLLRSVAGALVVVCCLVAIPLRPVRVCILQGARLLAATQLTQATHCALPVHMYTGLTSS